MLEARNAGKPIGDARGEMGMVADVFRYYAGAVERNLGDTIPVSGGVAMTFREPLGVVGADHAVELPAEHRVMEDGPGAGGRQHGRPQARRADAADRARVREDRARGRDPRGGRQRRRRAGLDRRRPAGRAPGRREGRVHGLDRGRRADRRLGGGRRSSASRSSSAASRPTSCSPTPTSRPPPRRHPARCSATPGRTAARARASSSSGRRSTRSWTRSKRRSRRSSSATRSTSGRRWAR